MSEHVHGSCYCKGVRFVAAGPSNWLAHCHCRNCRKAHGAGFVTWAGYPREKLEVRDDQGLLTRYATDTGATRSFCGRCGSTLFYEGPRWAGEIHVAVGCLDDPPDRMPKGHAYADRAPDWCPILDDLPKSGGESGMEPI